MVAIEREKEAKAERWGVILGGAANRRRLGLAVLMTFLTNVSLGYLFVRVKLITWLSCRDVSDMLSGDQVGFC
jgi:hypothetical protein